MISPQTKDETTGRVMKEMLKLPCTIENVAGMTAEDIKKIIYDVNYNATKARRIVIAALRIKIELKGKMPEKFEEVLEFEGVGEKIALLYMLVAMN